MAKKKSRLNVSLDDLEREKLEKLAEEAGLSLSRTIAQLIRKAKVNKMIGDAGTRRHGDVVKEDAETGGRTDAGEKGPVTRGHPDAGEKTQKPGDAGEKGAVTR